MAEETAGSGELERGHESEPKETTASGETAESAAKKLQSELQRLEADFKKQLQKGAGGDSRAWLEDRLDAEINGPKSKQIAQNCFLLVSKGSRPVGSMNRAGGWCSLCSFQRRGRPAQDRSAGGRRRAQRIRPMDQAGIWSNRPASSPGIGLVAPGRRTAYLLDQPASSPTPEETPGRHSDERRCARPTVRTPIPESGLQKSLI